MKDTSKPVLIFDMNETLLDLSEVRKSVADILNADEETASHWFEMALHYSLVDTVSGRYHSFGEIGTAALMMLAEKRDITLSRETAREALQSVRSAEPYPEVLAAQKQLSEANFRMAVLTNSSREAMKEQLENAQINKFFEQCLSVETIGKYKPVRQVYRYAARQLKVDMDDCLFVAAHGWDVAGAMAAGMQAAFISRPGRVLYPLSPEPAYVVPDLKALCDEIMG
jgi:2-haloacid dehalogenase